MSSQVMQPWTYLSDHGGCSSSSPWTKWRHVRLHVNFRSFNLCSGLATADVWWPSNHSRERVNIQLRLSMPRSWVLEGQWGTWEERREEMISWVVLSSLHCPASLPIAASSPTQWLACFALQLVLSSWKKRWFWRLLDPGDYNQLKGVVTTFRSVGAWN